LIVGRVKRAASGLVSRAETLLCRGFLARSRSFTSWDYRVGRDRGSAL